MQYDPFHALCVHRPALDRIVFHNLPSPLAELHSMLVVHLEGDSNDKLQIVVSNFSIDLPGPLGLNYSEFPDSCHLGQLSIRIV